MLFSPRNNFFSADLMSSVTVYDVSATVWGPRLLLEELT